jgi:hypothetical protein
MKILTCKVNLNLDKQYLVNLTSKAIERIEAASKKITFQYAILELQDRLNFFNGFLEFIVNSTDETIQMSHSDFHMIYKYSIGDFE